MVLEKTLESLLDCKDFKPVNPKGNQSLIFVRRTDTEAEAPLLWTPAVKSDSFEKTLILGKIEDRRRREQKMRWLDGMSLSKLREMVKDKKAWVAAVLGVSKSQTRLWD